MKRDMSKEAGGRVSDAEITIVLAPAGEGDEQVDLQWAGRSVRGGHLVSTFDDPVRVITPPPQFDLVKGFTVELAKGADDDSHRIHDDNYVNEDKNDSAGGVGGGEVIYGDKGEIIVTRDRKALCEGITEYVHHVTADGEDDVMPRSGRTAFLVMGHIACACVFALCQEQMFLIEGFHFGGFASLLTQIFFGACAAAQLTWQGCPARRGPMRAFLKLSVMTTAGLWFTNASLAYIDYPTRILFKSCKILPVMALRTLATGRRYYSVSEYGAAVVLVAGIVIFTAGNESSRGKRGSGGEAADVAVQGIALILSGVLFDALTSVFEEKELFRKYDCSHVEVIFNASIVGACITLATLVWTGELEPAVVHALQHPEVLTLSAAFSLGGYGSVSFILLIIKELSPSAAEVVKSARKILSVLVSFAMFARPVTTLHCLGLIVYTMALYLGYLTKQRKYQPVSALPTSRLH